MRLFSLLFLMACLAMAGCFTAYPTANRPTYSKVYADKYGSQLEAGSTIYAAGYNYTIEQTKDGKFIYKNYYPENSQITHLMTYSDKDMKLQNGLSKEWWDDGSPIFEGQMSNNLRVGEWKNFNGSKTTTGKYVNGKQEGQWVTTDSLGTKISEMTYVAGKLNGPFKNWDKSGQLQREGAYKDGKIDWEKVHIEGPYVGEIGDSSLSKIVEEKPSFPGCDQSLPMEEYLKCTEMKMLQFIYSNIKYPPLARENGIMGTAIIGFVVEKDGTISNIKAKRGICKEIKAECERVVGMMPNWNPGKQRGKPVRVMFNLPVKFKLE